VAAITIEDVDRGRWTLLGAGAAPRVLVVLGGAGFAAARLRDEAADATAVVAADAGAAFCLEAGLMPDAVVGDFDSLAEPVRARIPADRLFGSDWAETNDLEKALAHVAARWRDDVDVALAAGAAFEGGRADHALANLGPLVAEPHARITMVDGEGRLFALRRGRATFEGLTGATLSVLPWTLHGVTVSERGVRWPLERAAIRLGGRGISNALTQDVANVEVHEGVALVWVGA
jgi:thiamine pyrophosphokinase